MLAAFHSVPGWRSYSEQIFSELIFSLLINGATAVDCYQSIGFSLAGDVSVLIPSTTKVFSARAETTEMNTLKGW